MPVQFSSKLQSLLIPSTRVVVFTGAGISAESGVPTFRGQNGLWNEFRVEDLATPQALGVILAGLQTGIPTSPRSFCETAVSPKL